MARFTTLLLLLAACQSSAPPPEKDAEPAIKKVPPFFVHPKLERMVTNREYKLERTSDGRLKVRMVIASTRDKDLPLIVHAEWLDADGIEVERSDSRTLVVGSWSSKVFEEESRTREPVQVRVSVRASASAHLRN